MMPKTRYPGNGVRHRIRSVALLLPAPLRYDWQHSSSQLPIIFSDARWTSSPSGRYYLRGMHDIAPPKAKNAPLPFPFGLKFAQTVIPGGKCMRPAHGCHSYPALLHDALPGYIHIISRATISSSQRPPTGLAATPPPRLPIDISNAHRISSPGGRFFLHRTHPTAHGDLYLCGESPGFWPEFCQNFCLTCTKRIGAVP